MLKQIKQSLVKSNKSLKKIFYFKFAYKDIEMINLPFAFNNFGVLPSNSHSLDFRSSPFFDDLLEWHHFLKNIKFHFFIPCKDLQMS